MPDCIKDREDGGGGVGGGGSKSGRVKVGVTVHAPRGIAGMLPVSQAVHSGDVRAPALYEHRLGLQSPQFAKQVYWRHHIAHSMALRSTAQHSMGYMVTLNMLACLASCVCCLHCQGQKGKGTCLLLSVPDWTCSCPAQPSGGGEGYAEGLRGG